MKSHGEGSSSSPKFIESVFHAYFELYVYLKMAPLCLTDIDFETIEKCTDARKVKKMLRLLEEDGGYYADLIKAAKARIEALTGRPFGGPPVSEADRQAVAADLLLWEMEMKQKGSRRGAPGGGPQEEASPPELETIDQHGVPEQDETTATAAAAEDSSSSSSRSNSSSTEGPIARADGAKGRGVAASFVVAAAAAPAAVECSRSQAHSSRDTAATAAAGSNNKEERMRIPVEIVEDSEGESQEETMINKETMK